MPDVPPPNEPVSDGSGDSGIQKQPENIDAGELLAQHQDVVANNNQTDTPQLRSADGTDCEFNGSESTRTLMVGKSERKFENEALQVVRDVGPFNVAQEHITNSMHEVNNARAA